MARMVFGRRVGQIAEIRREDTAKFQPKNDNIDVVEVARIITDTGAVRMYEARVTVLMPNATLVEFHVGAKAQAHLAFQIERLRSWPVQSVGDKSADRLGFVFVASIDQI